MRDPIQRFLPRLWLALKAAKHSHTELELVGRLVPEGCVAVDIGASVGLYARAMARRARRVVAFEPNPEIARLAARAAARNVEVINAALSASEGTAVLRVPLNARGRPTSELATIEGTNSLEGMRTVEVAVQMRRLDDLALSKVGFIKIDTEGHEESVIEGAWQTISGNRPAMLIELDDTFNPGVRERVAARLGTIGYAQTGTAGASVVFSRPPSC